MSRGLRSIRELCDETIWMDEGEIAMRDKADRVAQARPAHGDDMRADRDRRDEESERHGLEDPERVLSRPREGDDGIAELTPMPFASRERSLRRERA